MKRYAIVYSDSDQIASYMPGNYTVIGKVEFKESYGGRLAHYADGQQVIIIGGEDVAGWTLDGYVMPRLQSGLYVAEEIDLSHPIMKVVV